MAANTRTSASPTGGYTPHRRISTADDNLASVKASPGTIGYIIATNINAAVRYLHLFNKASAPVLASDAALLVHSIVLPGGAAGSNAVVAIPAGIEFSTGIAYAVTSVAAGTTGAVSANEHLINIGYK